MLEEQLVNKQYYETFMEPYENRHPVVVLGEAYMNEQRSELVELSYIRFAQGEVYFQSKDYETAIFKWENINNELQPWAKKNMADAYFELELYPNAEEIYKSIIIDSPALNVEVALKLFELYIRKENLDSAVQMIKRAILINPDYYNVTELANLFFEEREDWENAIELAVNEAIRIKGMRWVDRLIELVDNGRTKSLKPQYFSQILMMLANQDIRRFELLAQALWNSYKQQKDYFPWLLEFNRLFENIELSQSMPDLSLMYQDAYLYLLDGKFFIKEVSDIIPGLLTNWMKVADKDVAFATAAVLAWSEMFPSSIQSEKVYEAEKLMFKTGNSKVTLLDSLNLFDTIVSWAEDQDMSVSPKLKWMVDNISDLQTSYLLVAGDSGNAKTAFLHNLLGESSLHSNTSANVMYTNHDTDEIYEITDLSDSAINRNQSAGEPDWLEIKVPNVILREHNLAIMNSNGLNRDNDESLNMADSLIFLVNEWEPFNEQERELFVYLQQNKPDLPVHFLLLKNSDTVSGNLSSIIGSYFPKAKQFTLSLQGTGWRELHDLGEFLKDSVNSHSLEEDRSEKVLYLVRKLTGQLLEKRVERENNLDESIKWNEQLLSKLNGAIHQLSDVKSENTRLIKKALKKVKDDIEIEVIDSLPGILRECSALIKDDSDLGKIHFELNKEMNKRIDAFVNETILPKFHDSLQRWIQASGDEFTESQTFLDGLCDGFNALYEEDRLQLDCDFKVLDDWGRDIVRITCNVHLEDVNIFLRRTPAQVLLKGAGKLLGPLSQNKSILANKYKSFIENEEYYEISKSIANKILHQVELIENGIDRDVSIFFQNPEKTMLKLTEETKATIESSKEMLKELQAKPETYQDPMTLFQNRLRQYEWVMIAGKDLQYR